MSDTSNGPAIAEADERVGFARDPRTIALVVVVVAALAGGIAAWFWWPRPPGNGSADAGLSRDMSVHHNGAVEMALIIRDRTADPQLFALATDIVLTQQTQIGMMTGWLDQWDLPLTGEEPAMAWMGHPVTGLMPGMASAEQIQQLRDLPTDQAEVLFIELMIAHHTAGVTMAEACLDRCDEDVVRRLARGIVATQNAEIAVLRTFLEQRGGAPG
jgi:uncharacterized protein (DUF305 family)